MHTCTWCHAQAGCSKQLLGQGRTWQRDAARVEALYALHVFNSDRVRRDALALLTLDAAREPGPQVLATPAVNPATSARLSTGTSTASAEQAFCQRKRASWCSRSSAARIGAHSRASGSVQPRTGIARRPCGSVLLLLLLLNCSSMSDSRAGEQQAGARHRDSEVWSQVVLALPQPVLQQLEAWQQPPHLCMPHGVSKQARIFASA